MLPELQANLGDYNTLYSRLLAGHGHDFDLETFSVVDMDFPLNLEAADGWLISGSKHGTYEDHAFIPPLEDLIRAIHASGKPMIGICFGHQIISQALGGTVVKYDQGWSVGRVEYNMQGQTFALNAWHQDQVVQPPKGAITVGYYSFCLHAALTNVNQTWTMQPHQVFQSTASHGLRQYNSDAVELQRMTHAHRPM